eukprot:CAMPEP_0117425532 /NCGR_PEP_ID=MMETSP0758-20121206/5797_1 /TAXON_ID=63605 /ORGANISM="Percolomonas cosmopolitus, Strain AE-1 (ATCC 50343)" /LENGTH=99 /DNA_ID=CAMNT_0005210097 /DNA_START=298 /DNA_END=594 /DNA_ORIENTATION=+
MTTYHTQKEKEKEKDNFLRPYELYTGLRFELLTDNQRGGKAAKFIFNQIEEAVPHREFCFILTLVHQGASFELTSCTPFVDYTQPMKNLKRNNNLRQFV